MKLFSLLFTFFILNHSLLFAQKSGNDLLEGCTVITISKGGHVFFGGNDDYINPDSYYWVDSNGTVGYRAIWIGTPDNVQQGVNEVGLAYDANGLPRVDVNPHTERTPVDGGYTSYPIKIMHECSTVEEIIAWVNTHQWHSYMHDQMHFADATGDAVIISAGPDGEVVFTRKPRGDGFLVSTNFNVADHSNGFYPCERYSAANDMLQKLIEREGDLTFQDAVDVLDAVHVSGAASWTIESMVADLKKGTVYLYYFHQFDKPVILNVRQELAKPHTAGPLSKLFPQEVQQEADRRYQKIISKRDTFENIGKWWLALSAAGLVLLLLFSRNRKGLIFWIPVVTVLGPIGFIIWLAAGYKEREGTWQKVMIEAAGDVIPSVTSFVAAVIGLLLIPEASGSMNTQLLLFLILPLFISWFIFNGLLTFTSQRSYFRIILKRLPHAWIAANLGLACILAPALYLVIVSAQYPLPFWIAISWWGVTAVCSLPAILLLIIYNRWTVRGGYLSWNILASGEGTVTAASWRKLWWLLLLSYAALIGGMFLFAWIK